MALKGEHLVKFHTFALIQTIAASAAISYKSVPIVSSLAACFALAFANGLDLSINTLARLAILPVIFQSSILMAGKQSFTIGEATFLAHCLVALKMSWNLVEWTVLDRLSYGVWISTFGAIMIAWLVGGRISALNNTAVLAVSLLGCFFATFKAGLVQEVPNAEAALACLTELFATEGTWTVLAIWAAGFVAMALLSLLFSEWDSKEDNVQLQIMRKSFHFIALGMFMPAGFYNVFDNNCFSN